MTKVFNSTFEVSLRILLLLSVVGRKGVTVDSATAYDFTVIYSRNFGISNTNLHGDNEFAFSEFATRRTLVGEALKSLVLDGLINVLREKDGFHYCINKNGIDFVNSMTSEYAKKYKSLAVKACHFFSVKSDTEIMKVINQKATEALRR